jgi:hypothetical protein
MATMNEVMVEDNFPQQCFDRYWYHFECSNLPRPDFASVHLGPVAATLGANEMKPAASARVVDLEWVFLELEEVEAHSDLHYEPPGSDSLIQAQPAERPPVGQNEDNIESSEHPQQSQPCLAASLA